MPGAIAMEIRSLKTKQAIHCYGNPQPAVPAPRSPWRAKGLSAPTKTHPQRPPTAKQRTFVLLFIVLGCSGRAQHSENGLVFSDWHAIQPMADAAFTASYGRIRNDGTAKTLIAVTFDCAQSASLHETRETNGRLAMRSVPEIPLPKGEVVEFTPGGRHLMLEKITIPAGGHCKANFLIRDNFSGEERLYTFRIPFSERR